jgi:hypothetical protein
MIDRSNYPVVKKSLREAREDDDYVPGTPEERWNMMWQLALDAWAFSGKSEEELAKRKLSRHVVRVVRRRR